MSKFTSNASGKFSKIAKLEIRNGSAGDDILCGFLDDGTEVMVVPERDRTARRGEFILMVRGNAMPIARGDGRRGLLMQPTEPYYPGAPRVHAEARRAQAETAIEATIRRLLIAIGVQFREKVADLPGTPDFFLPDVHAVVFTNGCFWHGHACASAYPPHIATESAQKIRRAKERDPVVLERLQRLNLRTLVIWECALTGAGALTDAALREACEDFITGSGAVRELAGRGDYAIA